MDKKMENEMETGVWGLGLLLRNLNEVDPKFRKKPEAC